MGDNIMAKQIILHYPGSYIERPHTLVCDSEEEYQEFLAKKSYKLKPNVKYGVFMLGAVISTEYASKNLKIDTIHKNNYVSNFSDQRATTAWEIIGRETANINKDIKITKSNTDEDEDDVIIID